jgi:hypothetical protein
MEIVGTRMVCAFVVALLVQSVGDAPTATELAAVVGAALFMLFMVAGAEYQARRPGTPP